MKQEDNFYVISTPIGNLGDITIRAIEILRKSNYIICENINHSQKLLLKYDIKGVNFIKISKFNEMKISERVIKILDSGKIISLISDAGTPAISDPGQFLIRELVSQNFSPISIPGPTSLISALSISGEIFNSFTFIGFLRKTKDRIFSQLSNKNVDLLVAFETPHRILKTLEILRELIPNSKIILINEITKKFEKVIRFNIMDLKKNNIPIKGEFVIIIKDFYADIKENQIMERVKFLREEKMKKKTIVKFLKREGLSLLEIKKIVNEI